MSASRSTPQRFPRRSTRSPPNPSAPATKQFTSFSSVVNPPTSSPASQTTSQQQPSKHDLQSERPALPLDKKNPLLANYRGKFRSVKTQNIPLQNHWSITIARVKIPTSTSAAAHLIKRYDTNAISATSFFDAAFPDATTEEQSAHMAYLDTVYDTASAGGQHIGPECKLTGTWVPIEHAESIAEWYGLTKFATELISYPNPKARADDGSTLNSPTKPSETSRVVPSSDSNLGSQSNSFPLGRPTPSPKPIAAPPRSSKRARVAPPSFGNTSPSHFSLPAPATPALGDIPGIDGSPAADEPDPTEEPMTISNDEGEEPERKTVQVTVTETSVNHRSDETPNTVTTVTTACVVGTDEQVELAKRDALNLVASLQESSASGGVATQNTVSSHPSLSASQSKRRIDQAESEDTARKEVEQPDQSLTSPKTFFGRLWARSGKSDRRSDRPASAQQTRAIAPLPKTLLPRVTPAARRNLAVAGIVVAGAAASIAPYFF